MKFVPGIVIIAAALMVAAAYAAGQDAQLQHNILPAPADPAPGASDLSWGQFMAACDRNLNRLFTDRFNPLETMNWSMRFESLPGNSYCGHAADTANHAFSQSFVYGAREATIDLPVMAWLADHQSWLADFFRNSLGSVEEEDVAPTRLSYRPEEQSWWQQLSEKGNFCYGIRPFKTNPYAFFGWAIKDGDQMIVLSNVRYHYENFADHNFEFAMSVPLASRCSLDLGTSYQFGRHEDQKRLTVKLSRGLLLGGILNIGLELQQHPRLLVGMAVPW